MLAACGGSTPPPGGGDDQSGDSGIVGGSCSAVPAPETGDGTYYAADGTGNCSFDASPDDLMVVAMNHVDYADAQWCGACLAVTGPNGFFTLGGTPFSPQYMPFNAPSARWARSTWRRRRST